MEKFWMCLAGGTGSSQKKHEREVDARAEAERLARATNKAIYLLEVVDVCVATQSPVAWESETGHPVLDEHKEASWKSD